MNGKKLYKNRNGAMVAGVCNGLASYLNVDVSLVRLAAVLLACFTGVGIVAYIAAAVILPELNDPNNANMNNQNYGNMNNQNYGGMNNNMNNESYVNVEPNPVNKDENGKDII